MLAQKQNVGDTPWVLLLFCVALIPSVLNLIPLASLAAVLIYTGYKLAKAIDFKTLFKQRVRPVLPFVITIIAILLPTCW